MFTPLNPLPLAVIDNSSAQPIKKTTGLLILRIVVSGLLCGSSLLYSRTPLEYVDPFIGTSSGRWFFFTPAARPFGLVKLAPDTTGFGGYGGGGRPSGYRYSDSSIVGFSHLHDFQLGGILLMPETGPLVTIPGPDGQSSIGWRSAFSKNSEHAEPGNYRVYLDKYSTEVELTATTRVGCQRYTFPKIETARVIIDVGHPLGEGGVTQTQDLFNGSLRDAFIERVDDHTLHAYVTIAPSYAEGSFTVYTEIRFSRPFKSYGAYRDGTVFPQRAVITGFGAGFYVEFDCRENSIVEIETGISFVSLEQAKKNLENEANGQTFDQIVEAGRKEWNDLLGRVQIRGDQPEESLNKTKFYTALWHVLLGRGISSDFDGSYLDGYGRRKQIPLRNGKPEFARYNSDALWGSFWNLNQVWSLLYPEQMTSFAKYLLSVYEETGWLQDGFVVNQRAPGMLSNQTTSFLAAAFAREPDAFDREELWKAIWKNQTVWKGRPRFTGQEVLPAYSQLGYAPCDDIGDGPTGHTLEYAYEDWCAAEVALRIGKSKEGRFLLQRSHNWRNNWDAGTDCFRPRRFDGEFFSPFQPKSGYSFPEGTALQYRWFVPQSIPELVRAFGEKAFASELEKTFVEAEKLDFGPSTADNVAGIVLAYNHGNQPDLHAAWLFHFIGRKDLTERYVKAICRQFYGTTPERGYGLAQDEDQGQLGAWFVLASLGLFDVEGMVRPEAQLEIISPLFSHVDLTLSTPGSHRKTYTLSLPFSSVDPLKNESGAAGFLPLSSLWKFPVSRQRTGEEK